MIGAVLLAPLLLFGGQTKPPDPDREELRRMDEEARIRERNATMRLPTQAQRNQQRALQLQKLNEKVTQFERLMLDACTTKVNATIQASAPAIERSAKGLASALKDSLGKPDEKVVGLAPLRAISHPEAFLCAIGSSLRENLSRLTRQERQGLRDQKLYLDVLSQLSTIEFLSKQIDRYRRR